MMKVTMSNKSIQLLLTLTMLTAAVLCAATARGIAG